MMNLLLVEPDFPYPAKSKNKANSIHKNFIPIGLLKLGAYYRSEGYSVKLVRGNQNKKKIGFVPSKIFVTSLFTYWSEPVWDCIRYYKELFPSAEITIGGIYATLHHETAAFQKHKKEYSVKSFEGLHNAAEKCYPDYSLLEGDVSHHVTHATRGCIRKCPFCGVWRIEPQKIDKDPDEIFKEIKAIGKNMVIFFDNNFLAHKKIKDLLEGLSQIRVNNLPVIFESQSGFDGRLLSSTPELANLLKNARFQNIRIAWDNSVSDAPQIKQQIKYLSAAGYNPKDLSVFMIYNFDISYEDMLRKINYCAQWGVQITDCRYRPLTALKDGYNPSKHKKGQTSEDYYIHEDTGWTDSKIRAFRKQVRQHNIWIRYAKDKGVSYDKNMEKWSAIHNLFKFFNMGRPQKLEIIENSKTILSRLEKLRKVRSYIQKHNLTHPNFENMKKSQIDKKLDNLIKKIRKSGL